MNHIIKGQFYKLLENDYLLDNFTKELQKKWSFSFNFFVKSHGKKIGSQMYIQIHVIMRCVIKGLQ